jgi:hypothetical protein
VNRKAKVLCGQLEISWDDLVAALMIWKKNPDIAPLHQRAFLKAMHLAEFRDRFLFKKEPISLLNAMQWSYQTIATDPRDKIFGLLGLCHDGDTLVPIPNYKQPLEEIITDMSKRMMTFNSSLDLICFRGTSLSTNTLPSWTPNFWSDRFDSMTIYEMKIIDGHNEFPFDPVVGESTNQILQVKGKKSGQVLRLTSELAQPTSDGRLNLSIDSSAPWILSTENQLALDNSGEGDLKIRDSIWQTLTMGLLPTELNAKAALLFSKLWRPEGRGVVHNLAMIDWIDRNASLPYGNWTLQEWSQMKALSPSLSASSNVQRWKFLGTSRHRSQSQVIVETQEPEYTVEELITFIDTIERVLKSRMRLAVVSRYGMSDGDYIGMAHPCTRMSDEVWHIRGCSVPVVLRRIGGLDEQKSYKVVGAMYLHDAKTRFEREERWIWGETGANAAVYDPEVLNLS